MDNKKILSLILGVIALIVFAAYTLGYVYGDTSLDHIAFVTAHFMLFTVPLGVALTILIGLIVIIRKFTSRSVTTTEKRAMSRRLLIVILILASIVSFSIFLNGLYNDFVVYR